MAFVFQAQRWIGNQPQHELGPGSYNVKNYFNSKGGVITPDHKSQRSYKYSQHKKGVSPSQNSKICVSPSKEQNNKKQSQGTKKVISRAMSAKLFSTKSQLKQLNPTQDVRNKTIFLQITNSNNSSKKQFENSIIKKQFIKQKKSIHSGQTNQMHKKNLFGDKNIRFFQDNKKIEFRNQPQENINFFQQCFTKPSQSKQNLKKFRKNSAKNQNFFFTKESNINQSKQNDNFIIAAANCKKQRLNAMKQSQKNKQQYCKMSEYGDMQTTGIQDSLELSFEYISDSTPGPGEYNLRREIPVVKSTVEKFGITQKRFKNQKDQQKLYFLNIKIPSFKKYSRASQQKVAFGKSRVAYLKRQQPEFLVYQNNQTFEQKSLKNLIKDRKTPGCFLSKCDRFVPSKKPEYFGPDFFCEQKQEKIELPNSIFMSKVKRQQRPLSPTAQIDYLGQQCNTLQKKIQKIKQKKQMVQEEIPGFYVSAPRFAYKQTQEGPVLPKSAKSSNKGINDLGKSFTFRKDQKLRQTQGLSQGPSPWTYETKSKWIKPSHHIRYKF